MKHLLFPIKYPEPHYSLKHYLSIVKAHLTTRTPKGKAIARRIELNQKNQTKEMVRLL